jgi:DNA invertase Pin-like site-specific DNA recombinase
MNTLENSVVIKSNSRHDNIKKIIKFNNTTNTYTIQWDDNSISDVEAENVSTEAIRVFNIIQAHNNTVNATCMAQGIQPMAQKAYIMIRCSVVKDSSVNTQHATLMSFCIQNNILIEYYSVDNGVSGRYNEKHKRMNNLNYEFGYRLPMINDTNMLIVNSVDRLGRHTKTLMTLIEDILTRGAIICIMDIECILTLESFKSRSTHLMIYEHCIRAQELSDEISKRVRKSISIRREKNIPLRSAKVAPKLVTNQYLIKAIMKSYEKYNHLKYSKISKTVKIQRVTDDIIKKQSNDITLKNMKISKTLINRIIKIQLNKLLNDGSVGNDNCNSNDSAHLADVDEAAADQEPHIPFDFRRFISSIQEHLSPLINRLSNLTTSDD